MSKVKVKVMVIVIAEDQIPCASDVWFYLLLSLIPLLGLECIERCRLDCAGAQAGLRLCCSHETKSGPDDIKLDFIFKLVIKRNGWLLVDTCPQTANHCALFLV